MSYPRTIVGEVMTLPKGFDEGRAVTARDEERGEGYYIFGENNRNSGAPYLAFAPRGSLAFSGTWEFFTGRGLSGSTNWVGFDRWQFHTDAKGAWNPGERAKVFPPEPGCRGFQADWNAALSRWLMLYGCGRAAKVRVALKASGPWSEATILSEAVEDGGPVLLTDFASVGPKQDGGRSATIYWGFPSGQEGHYVIMRSTLRQEGAE
jgi:hypothetical protein